MFPGLPTASLPLVKLFDSPYLFTVPAYQRAYAWQTREAGQLFDDLTIAAGLDDHETESPDYFLGTMLLVDPEAEGSSPPPPFSGARIYEVVDGQQRLVTISILASVLRDHEDATTASDEGSLLASRLHAMIASTPDPRDLTGRRSRIVLRDAEQRIMQSHVLARRPILDKVQPGGDAPQSGIAEVREHFDEAVRRLDPQSRRKLALYLMENCHVVVIVSRDIDRAHRHFTVLNERGRPLQRNDIIKVEMLRGIPPESASQALACWEQAHASLGETEFERYMGHLSDIHGVNKRQIITGVRTLIRKVGAERFITDQFTPLAEALVLLRTFPQSAQAKDHPKLNQSIVALSRLGGEDWIPAAMVAMQNFAKSPARAAELMQEIERLAYLLRLLCYGGGKRVARFNQILRALRTTPDQALASPAWDITREELRTIAFYMKDLHNRNQLASKLVLMRIEDELLGSPLTIDQKLLTVEHILPSRPPNSSEWKRQFPDAEERADCQTSLGNLALITAKQNVAACNKDFLGKLSAYREADPAAPVLVSNADVLAAKSWLPADIRAREARFHAILGRIWRIDLSGQPKTVRMFG